MKQLLFGRKYEMRDFSSAFKLNFTRLPCENLQKGKFQNFREINSNSDE
jgi:hypothetical protein